MMRRRVFAHWLSISDSISAFSATFPGTVAYLAGKAGDRAPAIRSTKYNYNAFKTFENLFSCVTTLMCNHLLWLFHVCMYYSLQCVYMYARLRESQRHPRNVLVRPITPSKVNLVKISFTVTVPRNVLITDVFFLTVNVFCTTL